MRRPTDPWSQTRIMTLTNEKSGRVDRFRDLRPWSSDIVADAFENSVGCCRCNLCSPTEAHNPNRFFYVKRGFSLPDASVPRARSVGRCVQDSTRNTSGPSAPPVRGAPWGCCRIRTILTAGGRNRDPAGTTTLLDAPRAASELGTLSCELSRAVSAIAVGKALRPPTGASKRPTESVALRSRVVQSHWCASW